MREERPDPDRRRFFQVMLAAPLAMAAAARLGMAATGSAPRAPASRAAAGDSRFPATPECGDGDEPTPSETQGPFFKPRSPQRASLLEPGMAGTRIVIAGRVFSRACRPVPGALLDFWHADDGGNYDNDGFRLRGHQFTDAAGRYRLETIVPGLYPGRTRHFHVRVQAPHQPVLTTQLYFPDEPRNRRDGLFRPDLLLAVKGGEGHRQARFHFVLDVT